MAIVARLVTFLDIDGDATSKTQMSISARHEAELTDGHRIVLLNDRGWGASISHPSATVPDTWARHSLADICDTARMVVGPDEPPDGVSHEAEAAEHWAGLERILRRHGVRADAAELRQLPHEVVASARLRARIGYPTGDSS